MTILQLIILQVIAHLLADFILQPQSWCDKKEKKVFTNILLYHILVVFVTSYALSFDFGFWQATIAILLAHFFIDTLKSWIFLKKKIKYLFFIDQLMHLISIVGIVWIYGYRHGINFLFQMDTRILTIIAAFILCAKPANIIIKFLLEAFSIETPVDDPHKENEKSLPNAGKLIGISERFLALALILLGQYEAVGLIVAAKSILRFNATQKSEYVLVGTLLSFGIAAFSGIIISLIR
jgi:hypothetical protein